MYKNDTSDQNLSHSQVTQLIRYLESFKLKLVLIKRVRVLDLLDPQNQFSFKSGKPI